MAAVVNALKEYWDEALAVGVGIVLTDVVGDTVKGWLEPLVGGFIDPKWMDAITELVIGVAVLAVGELWVPMKYKAYTRLASFGALGIGVANIIGTAIGLIPAPTGARAARVVVSRPPVRVTRAPTVSKAAAPEIFS